MEKKSTIYFYTLTLRHTNDDKSANYASFDGTITVDKGTTKLQAYRKIREACLKSAGWKDDETATINFDMDLNELWA